MAFTWVSSPSSISIIHRFGLFILSQIPWMPRFLIYSSHSLWMIDPFFYFVFKTWHFLFHFIPSVGETFFWACCVTSCLFSFPEVTMGVRLHAFCPSSTVSLNSIPESRAASSWMLAAMRTYSFQRWPIGNYENKFNSMPVAFCHLVTLTTLNDKSLGLLYCACAFQLVLHPPIPLSGYTMLFIKSPTQLLWPELQTVTIQM